MQKTLGGDRLGSGKKMKVELHNYERSTHDIGYVWRSTMAAGTLVPFMSEIALPGTTFDINLQCDIKTHPTIGPLFGSYKAQLDTYIIPIRLYNAKLHNNQLGVGRNMSQVLLPLIQLTGTPTEDAADLDNAQVNPSSLLAYVGIRGVGLIPTSHEGWDITRTFNCIPILAYWDIYKNYYANKQEEIGAVIHTPAEAVVTTIDNVYTDAMTGGNEIPLAPASGLRALTLGTKILVGFTGAQPIPSQTLILLQNGTIKSLEELASAWTLQSAGILVGIYNYAAWGSQTAVNRRYVTITDIRTIPPQVVTFDLNNIDDMRQYILESGDSGSGIKINNLTSPTPYIWLAQHTNGVPNVMSSQEGLAVKTYQSDLFNNWLKTENIEAISNSTAIDTSGGSFTIDTLVISKKVWNMLQRINVSGGSYDDWMDAVYVHERYKSQESPMYMGGLIKELVFQEVVSNSQSVDQPLGTLAGKGEMSGKHKGGNVVIHVDEPSYIIGIISLTPRVDYSQGNKWDMHLKTMDDFHKPALDEIGFQELITEQMAWWDTHLIGGVGAETWEQNSAGKQPAWLNYMTNVNRVYGNFAIQDNEMFMTLNRRYENTSGEGPISDLTTYIDPAKYNFIFAETALDAQNFWAQVGVNITARRKMSGKLMPNL